MSKTSLPKLKRSWGNGSEKNSHSKYEKEISHIDQKNFCIINETHPISNKKDYCEKTTSLLTTFISQQLNQFPKNNPRPYSAALLSCRPLHSLTSLVGDSEKMLAVH